MLVRIAFIFCIKRRQDQAFDYFSLPVYCVKAPLLIVITTAANYQVYFYIVFPELDLSVQRKYAICRTVN